MNSLLKLTLSVLTFATLACVARGKNGESRAFNDADGHFPARQIYTRSYGDLSKPVLVFIHGGPAYNSFDFEVTTAQALADRGFGVIVYDQLGSGRSEAGTAEEYSFENATRLLAQIIDSYQVKKVTLIGHSFGGTIGLKFLERYPERVQKLILTDAPVSFPVALKTILENCEARTRNSLPNLPESCLGAAPGCLDKPGAQT